MWNISLHIQFSILLYDVIHLKLTLIGCHYLLVWPVNQPENKRLPLSALPAATLRPDMLLQLPWLALFPTWQWSMFAKIPMVRKAIMESLTWGFQICVYFSDLLPRYWDIGNILIFTIRCRIVYRLFQEVGRAGLDFYISTLKPGYFYYWCM